MRGKPVLIIRHSLFVYLDSVCKGISLIYSLLSAINADNVDRLISRPARAASLALRMADFISLSQCSRGSRGFICSPHVIFAVSRTRLRPLGTKAWRSFDSLSNLLVCRTSAPILRRFVFQILNKQVLQFIITLKKKNRIFQRAREREREIKEITVTNVILICMLYKNFIIYELICIHEIAQISFSLVIYKIYTYHLYVIKILFFNF